VTLQRQGDFNNYFYGILFHMNNFPPEIENIKYFNTKKYSPQKWPWHARAIGI
jgi:hypothetical protein